MSVIMGLGEAAIKLRDHPRAKMLAVAANLNQVFRLAAWEAGSNWIIHYLPMRWDVSYARSLGWKQKETKGRYQRPLSPFYENGEWIDNAARAHPEVKSTKGRIALTIYVPVGHRISEDTSKAFKTLPERERLAMLRDFRAAAVRMLTAETETIKKGRGRGQLRINAALRARDKAISGKGKQADLPAGFVSRLRERKSQLFGEVSADRAARRQRWEELKAHREMERNTPGRQAARRSADAARQRRHRYYLRTARAAASSSSA